MPPVVARWGRTTHTFAARDANWSVMRDSESAAFASESVATIAVRALPPTDAERTLVSAKSRGRYS